MEKLNSPAARWRVWNFCMIPNETADSRKERHFMFKGQRIFGSKKEGLFHEKAQYNVSSLMVVLVLILNDRLQRASGRQQTGFCVGVW